MAKKITIYALTVMMILTLTGAEGCEVDQLATENQSSEITSTPVPAPVPVPVDLSDVSFSSNGNLIVGWYWLRDSSLTHQAEWTINNVPTTNGDIVLDMEVLATNTTSGGRGFDANFVLDYCQTSANDSTSERDEFTGSKTPPPPGGESGCTQNISLPNISPESDPVGYTCQGQVTIPVSAVNSDGTLNIKVYRAASSDNHVAFNKESVKTIQAGNDSTGSNNDGTTDDNNNNGTEQFINPDSDNDLVPDNNETLYGTNPLDEDSDDDGIIDGKDLSSTINPSEPSWNDKQKKGMVRIEQPVLAYGLDGWVDIYERYVQVWPPKTYMKKIAYKEDEGTKKSTMDASHYQQSLNKIFADQKFTCYKIDDKNKTDFASGVDEMWHDMISNASLTYWEGFFTPKRYQFFYDYISDYQLAYLKNSEEIKFPSESEYFKYLLNPVKVYSGKEQTIALQFKDSQMYQNLYDNGDNDYKLPAFLYSFYNNNNFDADDGTNVAYHNDNLAMVSLSENNNFEIRFTLPADKTNYIDSYLKITPVWVIKKNNKMDYKPMDVNWDLTGVVRDVIISKTTDRNTTLTMEYNSFDGLNNAPVDVNWVKNKNGSADYQTRTETMQMLTKDPDAPVNERYNDLEVSILATNYVEKINGIAGNVYSVIEAVTIKSNKIKEITDLPATHWARQANYSGPIAVFAGVQGIASVATNGQQAWTAYKNGEKMNVAYYSAKAVIGGTTGVANVVKVTENTIGYAGKAGRLAKLTTKKAGVILAVATGTVEASYNIYKYNNTDDPILKSSYAENVAANVTDTGISVAAVFSPHVLAVQATWMVEIEIYALIFGEDFAYQVAKSPGQAAVFLAEYIFTGDVPSQMSKTAYTECRDDLLDWIEVDNAVQLPYMSIFIDPDL